MGTIVNQYQEKKPQVVPGGETGVSPPNANRAQWMQHN